MTPIGVSDRDLRAGCGLGMGKHRSRHHLGDLCVPSSPDVPLMLARLREPASSDKARQG